LIEAIKVIPRFAIQGLFEHPTWVGEHLKNISDVAIISIYSNENEVLITDKFKEQLENVGCTKTLSLLFEDITDKENENLIGHILFSEDQAKLIIDFLNDLKQERQKILLVHCDAGVSRSGAVGIFACRYFKLDENEFRIDNTNILPNSYVYDLLYQKSGLKKSYEDFWTKDFWKNIPEDPEFNRMFI
jgi:predicted protein tyrosine phosphatase